MEQKIEGELCLLIKDKKELKAKIVRGFIQVGGPDHGKEFVSLILEDPTLDMWEREIACKLSDIKLLD